VVSRARPEEALNTSAALGVVSDAFPLLGQVDGAIVVARMGQSTRDAAERLREQLGRLEAPVLGIVANAIKLRRGGKYGYGYYGPAEQGGGAAPAGGPAEPSAQVRDA
jgi:Mrp family chromosome partitioning ATPase